MFELEINHEYIYTINNYLRLIRDYIQRATNYTELILCKLHEMCSLQNPIATEF